MIRSVPVVLPRAFLSHADRGCDRHPAFPAPSSLPESAERHGWLGRDMRGENASARSAW